MQIATKLRYYYITAILSLIFAIVGFGYNAWRLEVTEDNNTIRTASFEMLKQLSELEQVIYSLHYDKNPVEGSPRKGWVAIGLVADLAMLASQDVDQKAQQLKSVWASNWANIATNKNSVNLLINEIDLTRMAIKETVTGLK